MKWLFFIASSVVCLLIASIVPAIMWFLYYLVAPETSLERILILSLFWLGGGGLAIIGIAAAIVIWIGVVGTLA